jgi:class 3 adenylate cyclase/tetratricopeptide (TPR) repeat protein
MAEERKLVTILFADVTGSTALGDALDPEDVRALMGCYYQYARQIVPAHGGTLEKFIGDAVMAVFGLPQAHGNDSERALAAALALRAAVEDDALLAGRLILRIGVNTGEVVAANNPAQGEFLVTGDAVNIAARLEQAAQPGEILTSARTQAAAAAAMVFDEPRQIAVKGKREPVQVYPLVGPRPTRQLGRPPLVGRKPDLAQLTLLRERSLTEQRPQLVSLVAPAGAGKTRLLEEFLTGLDPAEGWQVATARCLPYGQALTYWPLRGLLEELLDEPATAFTVERVVAALIRGGQPPEEARQLAGAVLATLGIEADGTAERDLIFHAWRALLEALARQAPRMVVFEDLHWASDSLLDLVEHVMQPRTQAALLVIATSRPELLDRRPAWGGGRRNYTALALEPLNAQQTQSLVEALAQGLPESATQQIVERSGGNPFFAIELTRAASQQDGHDGDGQRETGHALPDTVHEAVLARLDQLAPREKAVLQAAAVAGRTFRVATLQAVVSEPTPGEIGSVLDDLLARDLIVPAQAEASTYIFCHILIRDVAYAMLARSERIRLHAGVAVWLEQFAAGRLDEFAELVAYHYREAVQLARQSAVPIALPFEVAVAVGWLERAGEMAGRVGAVLQARRHLEAAIALAPAEDHLQLYEQLGDCFRAGPTALEAYETALVRWRAEGSGKDSDPQVGARLLRKIVILRTRFVGTIPIRLSLEQMEALRTEARQLVEASGDADETWRVRMLDLFWPMLTWTATQEEVAEARCLVTAAEAYFEAHGDWDALSELLDGYAVVMVISGALDEFVVAQRRRLTITGLSPFERSEARGPLVEALYELGDYAGSIEAARQAVATLGPGLSPWLLSSAPAHGAFAACLCGSWSEVSELASYVDEAWEADGRDEGSRILWPGFAVALHVALAREDRAAAESALAALQRLAAHDRDTVRRTVFSAYRDADADVIDLSAIFQEDHFALNSTFTAVYTLAVMFVSERGVRADPNFSKGLWERTPVAHSEPLDRAVAIAEALAAGDDAQLATAIEDAEAHGLIPHAARMRIVLAQRSGDRTQLERTRPVLQQLGDRQFLRRLEEVESALKGSDLAG